MFKNSCHGLNAIGVHLTQLIRKPNSGRQTFNALLIPKVNQSKAF
jgi:hypothetical protein